MYSIGEWRCLEIKHENWHEPAGNVLFCDAAQSKKIRICSQIFPKIHRDQFLLFTITDTIISQNFIQINPLGVLVVLLTDKLINKLKQKHNLLGRGNNQ